MDWATGSKIAQLEILERFIPKKRRLVFKEEHRTEANTFINKVLTKFKVKEFLETDLFVAKEVAKGRDAIYIKITLKEQEIADFNTFAGWRIYATNAPLERLQTKDVLPCYRQEFLIEQQFHKLLTKTTSLLPIYLKNEGRIDALIGYFVWHSNLLRPFNTPQDSNSLNKTRKWMTSYQVTKGVK